MKSIRKILTLILIVMLMATSFAACGRAENTVGDSDEKVTSEPSAKPEVAPEKTPEATPEVNDESTPESTPEATPEASPSSTPEATDEAQPGNDGSQVDVNKVMGSVEGATYTNDYFKFSLEIPEGWYVASREELAQILQLTSDYLKSSSDITIDVSQQKLIPLLYTASSNPFSGGTAGPSIYCVAENISQVKSLIPDAKTYLNVAQASIKQQVQGLEMTFGDIETLTIDGQEVAKVTTTTKVAEGVEAKQIMYAVLKGDFVLVFTASYESDELDKAMGTLSFSK